MAQQQIDDYAFANTMYRPSERVVKVPGGRRRVTEPRPIHQTELLFPPSQNGQREVTYETACCNGQRQAPVTIITTGRKMVDDMTMLAPGLLVNTGRMPKRVTTRIGFDMTEN